MESFLLNYSKRVLGHFFKIYRDTVLITQLGVTRIVYLILSTLAGIIIGRTLGPDGKGLVSLVLLISAMLFNFSHLGLANSIVYYYGKGGLDVRSLYRSVVMASAINGGIVVGIFLLLMQVGLSNVLRHVPQVFIIYAACLTPINLLLHYLLYLFLVQENVTSFNIVTVLPVLIYCALLIILSSMGSLTIPLVLASWALGHIAALGFALRQAWSFFKGPVLSSWPGWAQLLSFGLKSYANGIVVQLSYRLDAFLLNYWLSPSELGLYTIAVGLNELLWLFPEATSGLLLSRSAKGHSSKVINRMIIFSLIPVTLVAVLIWIGGSWIILFLYGPQFVPAQAALRILLPGTLMFSFTKLYTGVSIGRGRPELPLVANIAMLVLVATGDLFLIPRWGIQGAALASTVAYTASAITFLLVWRRFQ